MTVEEAIALLKNIISCEEEDANICLQEFDCSDCPHNYDEKEKVKAIKTLIKEAEKNINRKG